MNLISDHQMCEWGHIDARFTLHEQPLLVVSTFTWRNKEKCVTLQHDLSTQLWKQNKLRPNKGNAQKRMFIDHGTGTGW